MREEQITPDDRTRPAARTRRRRWLPAVVALVTLFGSGLLPATTLAETPSPSPLIEPSASPAPTPMAPTTTGPTTLGETVTFHGRGYGHGVGMSQHGARGRAVAGQDAATILAHYYQGTLLAPIDPATQIRVLVLSKWAASDLRPLIIHGRGGSWTIDGIGGVFPADARMRLAPPMTGTTGWRLQVDGTDGSLLHDGMAPNPLMVRGIDAATHLQLASKATSYNRYHGVLRVVVHSATRVSVVNDVGLEAYLGGVVPVEMPSTWPAAALEAQAVAARSYAARRLRPTLSYFDVPDDSTSQIYRGVLAEKPRTNAAIAATTGLVLWSGSTIANTLFHSTAGGATESNENVYTSASGRRIVRPVSYLRGVSDRAPDGLAFDARAPYATWTTKAYPRSQLSAIFAADARTNVGELFALDLHDRGVSGRVVSVTLMGSLGSRTVSGELFRAIFNKYRPSADPTLKSTLLDLAPIP